MVIFHVAISVLSRRRTFPLVGVLTGYRYTTAEHTSTLAIAIALIDVIWVQALRSVTVTIPAGILRTVDVFCGRHDRAGRKENGIAATQCEAIDFGETPSSRP